MFYQRYSALFAVVTALAHGQQNVTVVAVDPPDRLADSSVLGEWATAGNLDGWTGSNVTSLAAAGGFLTGDDNSASLDASISRTAIAGGPDLDLGFNDYLQLRIKLPAAYAGDVKIEYGTAKGATGDFVYDPVADLTWYDVNDGNKGWDAATGYAATLDVGGVDDWRLPTASELSDLIIGDGVNGVSSPFTHSELITNDGAQFWTSTEEGPGAVALGNDDAFYNPTPKNNAISVVAVRSGAIGDVSAGFATTRVFVLPAASIPKDGAFHTYRLDLGLEVFWRDSLRDLRVTPLVEATGHFEIDYLEVGDVAGTAPALNLDTNFLAPLTAANTSRLIGKHVCVWWDTANTDFTMTHARRAVRMCEESFQVFCNKLGYDRPFRTFGSTTTPEYKINFVTWYGGYWAGGWANRGHMNVSSGGLRDEGWGNPVPHEFGHVVQMAQAGKLAGGHWESHANYLRAGRNLHFYATIPNARPAIDNLTGNSNYHPDHKRHNYADQRYYLSLDDYGTQFGLPANYAAVAWRLGDPWKTLIEKLAPSLPSGVSVKDVACESMKRWPMLDFVEKTGLRAQHWGNTSDRARHFWKQGAQLMPLPDKPGWWRVPMERAPDCWGYQMHDLTANAGATVTVEFRGLDMPGTGEDWRWCLAAISAGDVVRYSPVWAPGTQSFALNASETQVFLIVTATPDDTSLDLESFTNTKPIDKHADRLRYAYEVRLVNTTPAPHQFNVANPSGYTYHSNGGGVVGPSANVDSSAYVGPNAKVLDSARVLGTARIEDYAVVRGSATVQGSALVSGSALVESNASVSENARIRDRAWLDGGAVVKGRALVGGYTQIRSTTVRDDAIVRGCAYPFGGTLSGTAIADHDYSMTWTVNNGVHLGHYPWGGWWDAFYAQTLTKPRGLIASYRTEETSGEEWWDEFGALHGLLRGAPVRSTDSTLGSPVITFDGIDDYALLDRSVADTSTFSFACWIKPANAIGTAEPILFLGADATRALQLVRDAAGKAVLTIGDGTTTKTLTSTSTLPQGVWSHVAFRLDGATARIYVDGAPQADVSTTFTPLTVLGDNGHTTAHPHYLGRDFSGALLKGSLEDVRIYNVAMTDAEVLQECFRKGDVLGIFSPSAATDFNGTNTIAQSGVRNGRTRTLSAWVKPRTSGSVSNYEAVFDSDDERSGRDGSGIGLNAGKWVARLDGLGRWTTTVNATLGQWQHVALAFNGSSATIFVNGVQVATKTYSGPADDSKAAGKCFRIGFSQTAEDVATRQYFDGEIAIARIHDRALSAAEIVLDANGDGVRDDMELDSGTNPLDPLSQYDTWTSHYFGAETDPSIIGPDVDYDDDGVSNFGEFAFNGDPTDAANNGQVYVLSADSNSDNPDTQRELILTAAVRVNTTDFTNGSPQSTASSADGINYTVEGSVTLADGFNITVWPVWDPSATSEPIITGLPALGGHFAASYKYRSFSLDGSNGLPDRGFLRAGAASTP